MALDLYQVSRDKFEPDETLGSRLSFPCCVCAHRHRSDRDEPCRTCDHNANAEPPNSHLERVLDRAKKINWE